MNDRVVVMGLQDGSPEIMRRINKEKMIIEGEIKL